jgi:hypothetical protein
MRFIMMVKSDPSSEAEALPDQALLAKMTTFNEKMVNAGVMKGGEGLRASAAGARVRFGGKGNRTTAVDGPFAEARELVGGFWQVETASLEEAISWARESPFEGGEVEIRQLYELSDFPADPSEKADGWREQERAFREGGAPPAANTGAGPDASSDAVPAAPARQPGTKRFMLMLKSDRLTESGALPTPKALAEMGALMTELATSGAFLGGEGLKPSSKGAKVRFSGAKRTVIDGPFTEAKEMIAGYLIIQVPSKEDAVALAKRWLKIHVETAAEPIDASEIEIRQLQEMEDYAPSNDRPEGEGWREREQKLRDRLGS